MNRLVAGDAIAHRNNVHVRGRDAKTLMLAHGFGCDQTMWRFLVPGLENDYRIVLFDYVGSGQSDPRAYSVARYTDLSGYARDINEICEALDLRDKDLDAYRARHEAGATHPFTVLRGAGGFHELDLAPLYERTRAFHVQRRED